MLKHLHLLFVAILVVSFFGRVWLVQFKPELLTQKWLKVAPHVLSSLLILTGIALVFQGNWLASDYGWIVAKVVVLIAYVGLSLIMMKQQGEKRWLAFAGAVICLMYILKVAVAKQILFFL